MEVSYQLHTRAALTSGKSPRYQLHMMLGRSQRRSGCGGEEKIATRAGNRTPVVQSGSLLGITFFINSIILSNILKANTLGNI
jgi:hypothetical protein